MATTSAGTTPTKSIPIIRLDGATNDDNDSMSQLLRSTCINVGFFYLDGHGISNSLLERTMNQSRKLFALSAQSKSAIRDPIMNRGYTAMEEETLDPEHQSKGDTKEGFYIGPEISCEDKQRYNPSKLSGPNCWPTPDNTHDEWSLEECQTFRSIIEEYWNQMTALGLRVTQLLASALHLPSNYFNAYFVNDPMAFIRLLHYDTSQVSDPSKGIYACGAHSDYGMITLLLTDDQPGLQIYYENKWNDVPPRPSCFIVNLGDMLERWSNGLFKSTKHRVVTTTTTTNGRYSIPFFYEPNFDTIVKCLPTCCSTDDTNSPKYPPISSGQYLLDKYKVTHAEFQPSSEEDTTANGLKQVI